ncbi:endo-1,4-beta-xylanase [Flavobacterium flavipallidum]|uniref:Beta-xylanase n=1 Tax=Flavobacterium flavipallidum TaxID=3139140 RepID=A0ABU9HQ73_9FLAO
MKSKKPLILFLAAIISLSSCNNKIYKNDTGKTSLKNAYRKDFLIGTALSLDQINTTNPLATQVISREFNSITAENIMKSMYVQPTKGNYFFDTTDKFVALGKKYKMFIHGHTLIWHSQLAPWVKEIKDSVEMKAFMKNHINTVVSRYKGKIDSWDVVNEALEEDGTLRKSVFFNTIGKDYLVHAYKLAAGIDPKTDLYYNDYSLCEPIKRKGAVELVKYLQKSGAKIDGVGEQGHWTLNSPSLEQIEQTILDFSALGVKVAFSELDITVLPNPWDLQGADVNQNFENSEKMNPYPTALPESVQNQLAKRYEDIFKLFLKHKDKISRVTFWGVNDGQTWLNDWPIKGRTNYPLLFDRQFKPKKAYKTIISLKTEK